MKKIISKTGKNAKRWVSLRSFSMQCSRGVLGKPFLRLPFYGLLTFPLFLVGCGNSVREAAFTSSPSDGTITRCEPRFAKRAYNKPYEINGITYVPQKHYELSEVGIASYYGGTDIFHGRKTSNGEIFDMNRISAAHKTLPIPCVVQVTNLENGRRITVKINDRGPFIDGRIIDVSRKTAQLLGFYAKGTAKVHIQTLVPETILLARGELSDESIQLAALDAAEQQKNIVNHKESSSFPHLAHLEAERISPSSKAIGPENTALEKEELSQRVLDQESPFHQSPPRSLDSLFAQASASVSAEQDHRVRFFHGAHREKRPLLRASHRSSSSSPASPSLTLASLPPMIKGRRGYFIQTNTFTNASQAQKERLKLGVLLKKPYIKMENVRFGSKQFFRLLVGPFQKDREAQSLIKFLQAAGHQKAMVVYNG